MLNISVAAVHLYLWPLVGSCSFLLGDTSSLEGIGVYLMPPFRTEVTMQLTASNL